jgi:glycerophosphoryl diester phosphodiesterase
MLPREPLVIAHRGRPLPLPENSLQGIAAAYEQGADAVEIDVRRSLDGEAVLMHDWHMWRTAALPLPVLIAPSGWRRHVGLRGGGYMPLLSEALRAVPGDKLVVLDIKEAGAVAPALAAAAPAGLRVEVWSGRKAVLRRAGALAPDLPRTMYRICPTRDEARALIDDAVASGYQGVCMSWAVVDKELVAEASARGLRAYSEETDLGRMVAAVEAGLDGIVTDRPAEVRATLDALRRAED